MNGFHDAGARLTPEQRDRVLDLAARLQAQHEAGIRVDDLAQAAAEAGIDARFVHQAIQSVVQTPPAPPVERTIPAPDRNVACTLLGVLIVLNAVVAVTPLGRVVGPAGAAWCVLLAAVTSAWAVKGRLPVWLVSAALLMTLVTTQSFLRMFSPYVNDRYGEIVVRMILFQAAVALLAGATTRVVEHFRTRRTASTAR